jgi:hypothetical protein
MAPNGGTDVTDERGFFASRPYSSVFIRVYLCSSVVFMVCYLRLT